MPLPSGPPARPPSRLPQAGVGVRGVAAPIASEAAAKVALLMRLVHGGGLGSTIGGCKMASFSGGRSKT